MCPSRRYPVTTMAGASPDLRSAFDLLDSDQDGRISLADLRAFYSHLAKSSPVTEEDLAMMISTADSDRNGFVDFDEFETVLMNKRKGERENGALMEVFRLMDRDGDGKVGFGDLKGYLEMIGMEAGDEEVEAMIEMAGGQLHGGVPFEALVKLLSA
ncbi:hypothetical protein LUZ60_013260 [Juncus effusus]|nr:hypothetical protein LUZ60_013260 [Juncus effusus]